MTLIYLFDPLCGWCYGASPTLAALNAIQPLQLMPIGLFAREKARPMNAHMRDYAWKNDQRIQQMTGQPFSEAYHQKVLGNPRRALDSWPATFAMSIVEAALPGSALTYLQRLQHLRFVEGRHLTDLSTLSDAAIEVGINSHSFHTAFWYDEAAREAANYWIAQGQTMLQELGITGVPAVLRLDDQQISAIPTELLYQKPTLLLKYLEQQPV